MKASCSAVCASLYSAYEVSLTFSVWRKEWVVPSALSRPASSGQNMTERLGSDADAMRSATPFKILKWVRTTETVQHNSTEPEAQTGDVSLSGSMMDAVPQDLEAGDDATPGPDSASPSKKMDEDEDMPDAEQPVKEDVGA